MTESNKDAEIIGGLIARAHTAQEKIANYTQEQIDEVCLSVGWEAFKDENRAACAKIAVEETGMGVYEDKLKKPLYKVLGTLHEMKGVKSVGVIERDEAKGITKYAKPVGVVGMLTPVTNPTATPANSAVMILKGKNSVIFAPHPRAKESCKVVCDMMREGLKKVGAPVDLVQYVEDSSKDRSQELMRQVDLVVATGGAGVVKAAYSSGTPAYGVGAGNATVIVAEDADINDSADKITASKTFDNATSCSSDNSLVIQNDVFDKMIETLKDRGAYLCDENEKAKLEKWMWVASKKTGKEALNPEIVAVPATKIAKDAGLEVPENTRMLLVKGEKPGQEHFSDEKLSPVLTLWSYETFDQAIDICSKILDHCGIGHSCGIYTFNQDYISRVGEEIKVSRVMVRQAHAASCGGNFYNGMPTTTTLGCGTWGGNSTNDNIHWKHFINVTWVAEPIPVGQPTEQDMWGEFWNKYGK